MNLAIFFHAVNDIDWFEKTIILLKKEFQMISIHQLNQYYKGDIKLSDTCHITIDDGDISFYTTIFPILKKHNVPATLFVSPSICRDSSNFWFQDLQDLNKENIIKYIQNLNIVPSNFIKSVSDVSYTFKCLQIKDILGLLNDFKSSHLISNTNHSRNINLPQLLEIAASDLIEIGAHTLNHPILSNENHETSNFEISESIRLLESLLGKKIRFFAFPNGIPNIDFGGREVEILKTNNVELAFTTEPKVLSLKDNPLRIPRISISYGNAGFLYAKLYLLRYLKTISLFWSPAIRKRKIFLKLIKKDFKTSVN